MKYICMIYLRTIFFLIPKGYKFIIKLFFIGAQQPYIGAQQLIISKTSIYSLIFTIVLNSSSNAP